LGANSERASPLYATQNKTALGQCVPPILAHGTPDTTLRVCATSTSQARSGSVIKEEGVTAISIRTPFSLLFKCYHSAKRPIADKEYGAELP
jgi:hypothetical protein